MSEKCGFTEEEYENLSDFLDPSGEEMIIYTELIKLMKDPNYINQLPERNMSYIMSN